MGFYAPAQLVRNASEHGVEVRAVDVNHSRWDCTLEDDAIRLGLRMLTGLPQSQALRIEQARADGPYRSIADFTRRTGVSPKVVERLARADAFGSLELGRRASLWQALGQQRQSGNRP